MIPSARALLRPTGERLSGIDALFLHLETPRTPMHSGSVAIFEGAPLVDAHGRLRIEAIRGEIEQRLHLVPKLRRRVVFGLFGEVSPIWVDDPGFDISNHVRHVGLPEPADQQRLAEICAELMAEPLDREQPLWELWFIEGLEGGRIALLEKLHHAMADGLAGVELATIFLDFKRHPAHVPPPARQWHPHPPPSETRVVAGEVLRRVSSGFGMARSTLTFARHPVGQGRRALDLLDAAGTVFGSRLIAPRSSLNRPVGHGRQVAFVRQSLEDLRLVDHRYGVTLNDVVLSAVAGGMRQLFLARGEKTEGRQLQVLVPVGVAHQGDRRLGNRVSAMLPRIPLGNCGPVTRLRTVAGETARCKRHHQARVGELLVRWLDPVPQPLLRAVAALVNRQPFVNLVVTNVPGTPFPMYARSARMLEAFPLVPLAGNLSIGVAALSYDTELTIGLTADRDSCHDLEVLARGIDRSFAELVSVARRSGTRTGTGTRTAAGIRTGTGTVTGTRAPTGDLVPNGRSAHPSSLPALQPGGDRS